MKKKILHITGAMNVGGTETMLINLYRKINNDITFHFISYSNKEAYYDKEVESLGGEIIRLKAPNEVGFIKAINDIRKVIRENGPYDAVHTHMMFNCGVAMIAAYLEEIKVRVSHAHTTADISSSLLRKFYVFVMRILIRIFSTDFLACSNSAGKYLFGNNILKNKKYRILPNYIDYEKFINYNSKTSLREELRLNKEDLLICHIGRFITAKNHKFLIDITKEMVLLNNNIKLILVGIGDEEENIRKKVDRLDLSNNVYFLGIRGDIPYILKSIDLFILPSISEGLGLVLLEAQSSKVPCLVSEAIQNEVDLGLNLITQIKLDKGSEVWANKALNIIEKKQSINVDIMKSIQKKGYDLNSILKNLMSVYKFKLEQEKLYEEYSNSIF
ncbi:glycosyltransferase family 1 protein [Clostridium sp. NSJ-49]|uniref:glycosyltransferase family 1 protein n=1 Tax=Clostridium TaxID=1485 RepID=UPI00164B1DDC|nr:glycosyltransferase family 1 protein [Clostridium sp. NSJ-49]MBC5624024.1 glycosyltransferase family 1 protein [Clostridium sp. NSJ-49]